MTTKHLSTPITGRSRTQSFKDTQKIKMNLWLRNS